MEMNQHNWRARAKCRDKDPSFFYPTLDDEDGNRNSRALYAAQKEAKAFCADCPVATPCDDFAMANGERGIWAGQSEQERMKRGMKVRIA